MALAGLWETWRSPAGSFAIITTMPNEQRRLRSATRALPTGDNFAPAALEQKQGDVLKPTSA
jgi:hypothetical protein